VQDFSPEPDLVWVHKPRPQEAPLHLRKLAPVAVSIFLAVILSAAVGWVSIAVAALAGAALMAVLGIMPPGRIYREVDWRTLILIGGMYPMGAALQETGAAAGLADLVLRLVGDWGAVPALTAVGLLALLLTQPMHNAVAALIATPVALQVSASMGADPKAFALAVVVGASASFLLPVGHPAPLLVQEPGGYRNRDYLTFGTGAALLVLAVIALVIPRLWPLGG
jgi:di/tricarboxylate transporter